MTTAVERRSWFSRLLGERSVQVALGLWVALSVAVLLLSRGNLPLDRPALARLGAGGQVLAATAQLVVSLLLMAVTYGLTRRRAVPDMASRAPDAAVAGREVAALWAYGAAVLAVGQIVGRWLFGAGIGLHLNGSLFGATRQETPQEVWIWALYNLVFYAVVPFLVFRARGYSREALNLKSTNLRNDALVVAVILALEAMVELGGSGIFKLTGHQMLVGGALSFVVHLLGTGLPVMVFIYAILLPRYARLTGSAAVTVLLGALSYAALHLCEYWTRYDSLPHALLSVIFVVLTFLGPGLIKSYLTLRTGNAWVHLWAYHAIAPHVTMDTPLIVKAFGLRP